MHKLRQLRTVVFTLVFMTAFLTACSKSDRYQITSVGHGDQFEVFRIDTHTGQVWQFTQDRKWDKIPQP